MDDSVYFDTIPANADEAREIGIWLPPSSGDGGGGMPGTGSASDFGKTVAGIFANLGNKLIDAELTRKASQRVWNDQTPYMIANGRVVPAGQPVRMTSSLGTIGGVNISIGLVLMAAAGIWLVRKAA